MAAARDGSLQLSFGLGKYTNRGVMDGFAGISRGLEQWTVRSSRALSTDPEASVVGPIRYEVLEPLRKVRFALEANGAQPISFEWVLSSPLPPGMEAREVHVSRDRYRIDADIIRYHHGGTASGWVEIDGERTSFDDAGWISTRDHSWGVRYQVGAPLADIAPVVAPEGTAAYVLWFPVFCTHPDGSHYGLHFYYQRFSFGDWSRLTFEGGVEHANGRKEPFSAARPDLRFDDRTRRFLGGEITATLRDGTERVFDLQPVSDTGFHLATGLYGGFDDKYHGQWRGAEHIEGEYFVGLHRSGGAPPCPSTSPGAGTGRGPIRRRDRLRGPAEHHHRRAPGLRAHRRRTRPVARPRDVDQAKRTGTECGPRTRLDGSHAASPAIS